jgi:hypothetical protein
MLIDLDNQIDIVNKKFKKLHELYDYIIIGSGPAASVILNNLIKTKKKILVVEEGNFQKVNYKSLKSENFKIRKESRVFSVGGTSNKWSQVYSLFSKNEMYNNKNKNTWPISHKTLLNWCYSVGLKYKFDLKKISEEKIYKNKFYSRKFIELKKPLRFRKFFKKKNFDMIINCKVSFVDEKREICTIFFDKNFIDYIINSKKLIICAGGIESSLLILKSIKNNKLKELKNKKFVGRYFMDHPKCYIGELKFPKEEYTNPLKLKYKKNFNIYTGLSLFDKKVRHLNSYIRFEDKKSFLNLKKKLMIKIFLEMEPNKKNYIYLKNDETIIDLKISKRSIITAKKLLIKIIKNFSQKPNKENLEFKKNNLIDASHHMGGLVYPKIVNKNLKLQGLKNIFCCSSAVFPTSGSVNPTLIICALAERLSDFLSNK